MKTTVLLILDQFVNDVEWEVMTIIPTIVQTQHNVLTAEKIICLDPVTEIKEIKKLTYPEARKLYDQQQPEFTFTKVVQSLSAKQETKTAYTQYNVEDSKITES